MANQWMPLFVQAMLARSSDSSLATGTVKFVYLDNTYTFSAAHQFLSDITGVIGTAVTVANKTFTDGLFDGDVPDYDGDELDGETATQGYFYIDTGNPATSRLALFIDDAPQLPLTGAGEDQPFDLPPVPIADTSGDSRVYPKFAEALFTRPSDSDLGGTLNVVFVTADYTFDDAHEFLSSVTAGHRTGTPQTIGNKTYTLGVVNGDPVTFPGDPGITAGVAALLYLVGGSEGASRLVMLKSNIQGLPGGGLTTTQDQPLRPNATDGYMRIGATSA